MAPSYDAVRQRYAAAGQEHVFKFWDSLAADEQTTLLTQLDTIDPAHVNSIFELSVSADAAARSAESAADSIEPPPPSSVNTPNRDPAKAREWRETGLKAIKDGQVGIILLAGGQGTRLGSSEPKGCYNIGLPSAKSLFQLQAEGIAKLQKLANGVLPWYVMTSGPTRKATEAFFEKNKYFGLDKQNVLFFNQGVLPAMTNDGKIFLDSKSSVAVAPDGNGGIYAGLRSPDATGKSFSVISDMKKRGIKYLHAYCVDNCLVRVGDPVFLGYCISQGALCGTKVVKKLEATESVGVVAVKGGKWNVIEYSEISKELAEAKDPNSQDGELLFRAANVANHFYNIDFLDRIDKLSSTMPYHIARKKIAHVDLESGKLVKPDKPNGMKLELFIFDVLPYLDINSSEHAILEEDRASAFSPLKNAPNTGSDDPQTSRRDLLQLNKRWLRDAGAEVDESTEVELSPLVSYAGEGLEVVKGTQVQKGSHAVENLSQLEKLLS